MGVKGHIFLQQYYHVIYTPTTSSLAISILILQKSSSSNRKLDTLSFEFSWPPLLLKHWYTYKCLDSIRLRNKACVLVCDEDEWRIKWSYTRRRSPRKATFSSQWLIFCEDTVRVFDWISTKKNGNWEEGERK